MFNRKLSIFNSWWIFQPVVGEVHLTARVNWALHHPPCTCRHLDKKASSWGQEVFGAQNSISWARGRQRAPGSWLASVVTPVKLEIWVFKKVNFSMKMTSLRICFFSASFHPTRIRSTCLQVPNQIGQVFARWFIHRVSSRNDKIWWNESSVIWT